MLHILLLLYLTAQAIFAAASDNLLLLHLAASADLRFVATLLQIATQAALCICYYILLLKFVLTTVKSLFRLLLLLPVANVHSLHYLFC